MSVRALGALVAAVCAAALLGGCGGGNQPKSALSSATATSPSESPSPDCPEASRCYDFTDDTQGWPDVSDDSEYAAHDTYREGSYHVGVRSDGTYLATAPVAIRELDDDHGVSIEASATPGDNFPDDAAWGAACWTRASQHGRVGGFAVHVQPQLVQIGVDNPVTGAFSPVREVELKDAVKLGKSNDLTLTCRQDTSAAAPVAVIEAKVDGADPIVVRYPPHSGSRAWRPADGVELLASGVGADVYFDDVTVAAAPTGG